MTTEVFLNIEASNVVFDNWCFWSRLLLSGWPLKEIWGCLEVLFINLCSPQLAAWNDSSSFIQRKYVDIWMAVRGGNIQYLEKAGWQLLKQSYQSF